MNGIPMIGAISSFDGDNNFHVAYCSTQETNRIADRLAPYSVGSMWNTNVFLIMRMSA